jgi:hypothetical protein
MSAPRWHGPRLVGAERGFLSIRPGALRIVRDMWAPLLWRAPYHTREAIGLTSYRASELIAWMRQAAQAWRIGQEISDYRCAWNERNAALCLADLREARRRHSAAIRSARIQEISP